jgi:hypothetical protein
LEVHDEVQEDLIVIRKKHLMKHGGRAVKQVLKPKRILERTTSPEPIT